MNASKAPPDEFGGRKIEPAMRAWALSDSDVAKALDNLDRFRMVFIQQLLKELGIENQALAELCYGAYIGLDDLTSKNKADIASALDELKAMILQRRPV